MGEAIADIVEQSLHLLLGPLVFSLVDVDEIGFLRVEDLSQGLIQRGDETFDGGF